MTHTQSPLVSCYHRMCGVGSQFESRKRLGSRDATRCRDVGMKKTRPKKKEKHTKLRGSNRDQGTGGSR